MQGQLYKKRNIIESLSLPVKRSSIEMIRNRDRTVVLIFFLL